MSTNRTRIALADNTQKRLKSVFFRDTAFALDEFDGTQPIEVKIKSGKHQTILSDLVSKIEWQGTKLTLEISKLLGHHEVFNDALTHEPGKILITGTIGDYRLRGNLGILTARQNHMTATGSSSITATFSFCNWVVESKKVIPKFWVANVSEGIPDEPGNLFINVGVRQYFAYKLSGLYEYYLLPEKRRIIIDLQSGQLLDFYKLSQEQAVLSYVFGKRISLSEFFGIDENGTPCAQAASLMYESETPQGWKISPVPNIESDDPSEVLDDKVWEVPLFNRCSGAIHSMSKVETNIAIMNYVDSLTGNIIPAYLQVQVGLEAFARSILATANKLPKQTSIRVQKAFEHFGLNLSAVAVSEIKRRHAVVHEMMVSKAHGRLDGSELRRMEVLRLLLNLLIVNAIGYNGKIRHWRTVFLNNTVLSNNAIPTVPPKPLWNSDQKTTDEARERYFVDLT